MMTNMTQYGVHILILLVESLLLVSPGLICPEISYLGGPAQLFCTGGTLVHTYYNTGGKVATCGLTLNSSCDSTDMSAYRLSSNQTALNITSVQISDAGTWVCKNARNSNTSCHLTVANIPTYNITSDRATDAMDVFDGVSLTVDIRGFYCSAAHNLTLQVGSATQPLNMYLPEAVTEPTNRNFTISINVTESHFGDVELIFLCNGQQLNVSHRSVTQLQQNISTKVSVPKTPTCNITSDKDTETLTLYEEVTLTVDIAAYYDIRGSYCFVESNFSIQTGDVTQLLNVAGSGADHDLSPLTFNVTETHLGSVKLIFNCQHEHWNRTCDGVADLNNKTKTAALPGNAGLYTAFTPIIAASVVGAIVCFINAVIIIMFLVKRKQVTRIKAQASLQPSFPPYITAGAPGSSAYVTVDLNDAPSGSKNITVIDAEGYACAGDFVNKAENRSSSLTKVESNELSLATTSTDNPKNDLGVIVQHIIPEDTSHVNELYACINKTKDMTVHNDDTAI